MDALSVSPIELKVNQSLGEETEKQNANSSLFEKILFNSISAMENTQIDAKTNIADVLLGRSDNSHSALIALQKAELQMSFASSARDKVVQGVNQLINMQI